MKNRTRLFFLAGLIFMGLFINSCKKDNQGGIETVLTSGTWQLASVTATIYLGESTVSTEVLNLNCGLNQLFSFNADKSCTYANFECIQQNGTGKWELSPDKLILYVDMTCRDTTAAGSSKPFSFTRIVNLGQYSMVIETGDIQNNSVTKPRKVRRYGFVKQKTGI